MSVIKRVARAALGDTRYEYLASCKAQKRTDKSYEDWLKTPRGHAVQTKLRQLHNREKGRRAFIIGNGPSLNSTDMTKLGKEVTIGCNGLFLHFEKMGWVPTYYTVEDQLVAQDRGKQIADIKGTTKIIPWDLQANVPDQESLWVNFHRNYPGFPIFSFDLPARVFWGGTVTFLNLQLAVHLGCNPIYLIGIDHNYKTDLKLKKDGVRWTSMEADPNHFHPDYFGKGYRWHDPVVERMEQAYVKARQECEAKGIKIINATIGGKLEVFPRCDYNSLF